MIYALDTFLMLTAMLLCWYCVFGEHMPAAQFRKECCSVNNHRYTKPLKWLSLPKPENPSRWMMSQHCSDCGNYKTWVKE